MNRIAVAVVAVALAVPIIAQTDAPAKQDPQPQPAAASKQKDPTADPGVRKLSRRERKDRIKNLSDKPVFILAPILFPTQLRATASGFAAGVAKIGAAFGVFVLPILKGKFGVPAVLEMVAAVSVLGLMVTLVFGREDTE